MSQHDNTQQNAGQPGITDQDRQRADEIKERIDQDLKQKPGWGKAPGAGTDLGSGDYAHHGTVNDLGTDQYTNSGGSVGGAATTGSEADRGATRSGNGQEQQTK
jgi:hypothetical protein